MLSHGALRSPDKSPQTHPYQFDREFDTTLALIFRLENDRNHQITWTLLFWFISKNAG